MAIYFLQVMEFKMLVKAHQQAETFARTVSE